MEKILDKNKLWVVVYTNIKNIYPGDVSSFLSEFRNYFKFDESVNVLVIPIYDSETHIEFYNLEKSVPSTIEDVSNLVGKLNETINNLK